MENTLENLKNDEHTELCLFPDSMSQIAKVACAFANANGGSIYVGYRKNGKIAGCEPSETYSFIQEALSTYCFPPIESDAIVHQVGHKIVLEVKIPASTYVQKSFVNNESVIYIRIGDLSLEVNGVLKKYIELKDKVLFEENYKDELQLIVDSLMKEEFLTFTQLSKKVAIKKQLLETALAVAIKTNKINYKIADNSVVYALIRSIK
jgi:predicted HTH transcriptional regulator